MEHFHEPTNKLYNQGLSVLGLPLCSFISTSKSGRVEQSAVTSAKYQHQTQHGAADARELRDRDGPIKRQL